MGTAALLFPGQGAQSAGMGRDLAQRYDSAREVFGQASAATGLDMERVCFEDPDGGLSRTDLCQPAILTASIAALAAVREAMGAALEPRAAAGLSLGEYSALVAAGAMDFADAAVLVYHRGQYMQEACQSEPGTMYSIIGLSDEQGEEACRRVREGEGGRVWPANYNSPGQLVIRGEKAATARAAALCTEMGARRAIELKVAGAFHTPLMQPAAERLARELGRAAIGAPRFPVIANTTARPACTPEEIRTQLAAQLTRPVRWSQSMSWCVSHGISDFIEVGPGHVLQGLLRRIEPSCRCLAAGASADLDALAAGR